MVFRGGRTTTYFEEAADDGEDDDGEDGDDDTVGARCVSEDFGGFGWGDCWKRGRGYQLQALRADTTGFMVIMGGAK